MPLHAPLIFCCGKPAQRCRHEPNGPPQGNPACGDDVRAGRCAGASRGTHPAEPGWTGRAIPRPVRAGAQFRRARCDRRPLPFSLYPGSEHGTEQSHLRDTTSGFWLPCRAVDRPPRPHLCRAGSFRDCASDLSLRGEELDSQPRRTDLTAASVARTRTRRALSDLPVSAIRIAL